MFAIPSLDDMVTRMRNAFRANLPGSDAWAWPNNVNPSAKAIGGGLWELFGFADSIQQAKFALTAVRSDLDAHGAEVGLGRKPASGATGTVVIAAADSIAVAFGAVLQRSDGTQYTVTTPASLTGAGTLNVQVAATTAGLATNAISGTPLAIISGLTDVNGDAAASAAVGTAGLIGGADVEIDGPKYTTDLGTYRGRILFKKRNPPQGGAPSDYVLWASEIPGVTRVFVERLWAGGSTVRVSFMMDDTYANGIPQTADVAAVANFIAQVRPSGAIVTVIAPAAVPVNVTVNGLMPNTPATQSAVAAELAAAFRRLSSVAGNDSGDGGMPFLATAASFALSWIETAVGNAAGVSRGTVTLPAADVALTPPQIATLGTVTFT